MVRLRPFILHHWAGHYTVGTSFRFDLVAEALALAARHDSSLTDVVRTMLILNYPAGRANGRNAAKDALATAGRALALQPNDPEAHITMAWALLFASRPEEALTYVNSAMRLDPDYPNHYALFSAAAHYALGDLRAANKVLQEGLRRDPEATELLPVAASVLAQLGRRLEASALVSKWKPGAGWTALETAADKYFFVVRWEGDKARLNQKLNEGLALAALPIDATVEKLAADLSDGQGSEPYKTARYLGWYGAAAEAAVPALIGAVQSGNRILQKEAIIALGRIGPSAKKAIPALAALVDQPFIGFHAKQALELIEN